MPGEYTAENGQCRLVVEWTEYCPDLLLSQISSNEEFTGLFGSKHNVEDLASCIIILNEMTRPPHT